MASAKSVLRNPLTSTAQSKVSRAASQPAPVLFGTHLTLDGYGGDRQLLSSMDQVFTALNDLPALLDMYKIITPYVVRYDGNDKKDEGGYSGFVMIAESHISIHTFPQREFVSIDVYTCQGDLDVKTCQVYFQKMFGVKKWEQHLIRRGRNYGKLAS